MKNVKAFKIDLHWFKYKLDYWLPFSFEKLETLSVKFPHATLSGRRIEDFYYEFFNFISKHSSITTLTIEISKYHNVDWLRLARILPSLVEITIKYCLFSADEVVDFMAKFCMLKKFHFFQPQSETLDYDILCKRLGSKWEGQKTETDVLETLPIFGKHVNITLKRRF